MSLATHLLCAALLSASLSAQHGHRDPTPEDHNADPDHAVSDPKPDIARALRDSQELVVLSQTVYSDAQGAASGAVLKDLREGVKRIEKLCKKLRSELLLD